MAEEKKSVSKQSKKPAAPKPAAEKPVPKQEAPKPAAEKPVPKVKPTPKDKNILSAGDLAKTPVGLCQILEVFDDHCVVARKENLKVKYQISKEKVKKESK